MTSIGGQEVVEKKIYENRLYHCKNLPGLKSAWMAPKQGLKGLDDQELI
jgi:hypothetical protein